jgi:hypothetical protein
MLKERIPVVTLYGGYTTLRCTCTWLVQLHPGLLPFAIGVPAFLPAHRLYCIHLRAYT